MSVKLLNSSPLYLADVAISKCWDKPSAPGTINVERMERVANKNKHASTIEHLNYTFDITMSRACLQEWARHRMASLSVKSSRYTLKELKDEEKFSRIGEATKEELDKSLLRASKFIVLTGVPEVDYMSMTALENLRRLILRGVANDLAKYCMPEAYKTSLVWTVNARSLQNFLALRTSKAALWEIRDIAYAVYYQIPKSHRFLFKEFVTNNNKEK